MTPADRELLYRIESKLDRVLKLLTDKDFVWMNEEQAKDWDEPHVTCQPQTEPDNG